jgi:hypothetical protein
MEWTALLEKELPRPCFDRPLVCDGLPELSTAIIIGENPATDVKQDWWSYWSNSGFAYDRFISDYESTKSIRGTRLRLKRIRDTGVKAVETNFYRDQGLGGSTRKVSNAGLIQTLVDHMPKLQFVVFHGGKAKALSGQIKLQPHIKTEFPDHFRAISYPEIDALCQKMLAAPKVP